MYRLLNKITPKKFKDFDQYLLKNYPLVWGSRIHYMLVILIAVLLVNYYITSTIQINYLTIPNIILWEYFYLTGISLGIFLFWLSFQKMIVYIDFEYGMKPSHIVFTILFILFLIISLLQTISIPYSGIVKQIVNEVYDPSIPGEKFYNFGLYTSDSRKKYKDSVLQATEKEQLDALIDTSGYKTFVAKDSNNYTPESIGIFTLFRSITKVPIGSLGLAWLAVYNKADSVSCISIDTLNKTLTMQTKIWDLASMDTLAQPTIDTININYSKFREKHYFSKLYNSSIVVRSFYSLGAHNTDYSLSIAYYQHKGAVPTTYCDTSVLQHRLIYDKIALQLFNQYAYTLSKSDKELLNKKTSDGIYELTRQLNNWLSSLSVANVVITIFFIILSFCLLVKRLYNWSSLLISFTIATTALIIYDGFVLKGDQKNHPITFLVVILILFLCFFKVTNVKARTQFIAISALSLSVYLCGSIFFYLIFSFEFGNEPVVLPPLFFDYFNNFPSWTLKQWMLSLFSGVIFCVLLPSIFFVRLHKLMQVPKK